MLRYGESVFTKESKGTEYFVVVALLCKFWSTSKLCIYRYLPASSSASNVCFKKGKNSLSHERLKGAKVDWDFRISDLVKNSDGTEV